jgi:hypothetical protein
LAEKRYENEMKEEGDFMKLLSLVFKDEVFNIRFGNGNSNKAQLDYTEYLYEKFNYNELNEI